MKVTELTLSAGDFHFVAPAFKGSLRGLFFDLEVMTRLFIKLPNKQKLDDEFKANERETDLFSGPKVIDFLLSDGSTKRFQPAGISKRLHYFLTVRLNMATQVVVEMADTSRAKELFEQFKLDHVLGQNLEDCCFHRRVFGLIRRHHPEWVECHELCMATEAEMLALPGFGPAALRDLKVDLAEIGRSLGMAEIGLALGMRRRVMEYRSRRYA